MSEWNNHQPAHLSLFLPDLCAGGVGRVTLDLAEEFARRGLRVDLVLCKASGPYLEEVPKPIRVVELRRSPWFAASVLAKAPKDVPALVLHFLSRHRVLWTLPYLPALIRYLRQQRPEALLAAKLPANLIALWASRSVEVKTRVVISERIHLPSEIANQPSWRHLVAVVRRNYKNADAIVAISNGVADALALCVGLPRKQIATIYNGVVNAELFRKAQEPVEHDWFQTDSVPVVLGVGRLEPQKDFPVLLRAFARARKERSMRLVILGEGSARTAIEALGRELGIASDMSLPGWVRNPVAYMAHSAVFALSSAWEGFGNVIVQALAVGCPVVSTDCPAGPAEILKKEGVYGRLVPVGNAEALADALLATMDESPHRSIARKERRCRAKHFSVNRAADRYLDLLLKGRA